MQTRGLNDASWYPQTSAVERLPAIQQSQTSFSSLSSSPRGGSFGSSINACGPEATTSYASSVNGNYGSGLKTPSPEQLPSGYRRDSAHPELHAQKYVITPFTTFDQSSGTYVSMNQTQSYSDVGHGHMMNVPHTASSSAPPTAMTHYSNYQQPQPGPHGYSGPAAYPSYGQPNGVAPLHSTGHPTTTPMSAALVTQPQFPLPSEYLWSMALSTIADPFSAIAGNPPPPSGNAPHTFDTTGQIAPHGMKPRVTATLWEDEGSLCFQVEANGVCVARREGELNSPESRRS